MELKDLGKKFENLGDKLPNIYKKGLKAAATAMGEKLVDATPLKTGRLAKNWQASQNQSSHYDPAAKGTKGQAKADLKKDIRDVRLDDRNPRLYLNNAAPYAHAKLDRGKVKGAIRDPAVKQAVRKKIRDEIKKALRGH